MSELSKLVEEYIERGEISRNEHDRLMENIHRDGQIDPEESRVLSLLFKATQSGALRIIDVELEGIKPSHRHEQLKTEALARSMQQATGPSTAQAAGETKPTPDEVAKVAAHDFSFSGRQAVLSASAPSQGLAQAVDPPTATDAKAIALDSVFGFVYEPRLEGPCFSVYRDRLLDVRLSGGVWMKTGAMVGYYGKIKFTREGIVEHGLLKTIKRAATGEGTMLTKAIGDGSLYLADMGKKISVLDLRGQSIVVNGSNVLAFEHSVQWDIILMRQIAAAVAGGFFSVRLFGTGMAAITTHYDPIVLRVTPNRPVNTDMAATVAWSGDLVPQIKADISGQTLIGRGSGETIQMLFQGDGYVVIQPYEEIAATTE